MATRDELDAVNEIRRHAQMLGKLVTGEVPPK